MFAVKQAVAGVGCAEKRIGNHFHIRLVIGIGGLILRLFVGRIGVVRAQGGPMVVGAVIQILVLMLHQGFAQRNIARKRRINLLVQRRKVHRWGKPGQFILQNFCRSGRNQCIKRDVIVLIELRFKGAHRL